MIRLLLVAVVLASAFFSCTNNPEINKDLVYSTLNDIIQQDTIFARIICGKFDQVKIPDEILNAYFSNDKSFIEEQIQKSSNLSVDTGRLYFYWPAKGLLEKSFIDTTCSKNIFYHVTYPVFSRDLQTVVIGITEDCNCMLGGWGYKAVYKRTGKQWKFIKKFDSWIS
ncbi:hypothetical protein [Ferruginibacter sp. SUN106]|uniref:hypothetical protein n=1 Tax=Ferruginibacter sp. SUN106 TaxID=2978348 RepID=UPI003D35B32B